MGLIICNKHGEAGFLPHISKELSDKVLNGELVNASEIVFVEICFIDEEDGEEMFQIEYWMTKTCSDSVHAQGRYRVVTDEDERKLDALFDPIMKGGGTCIKCFHEFFCASGLFVK